jgi:hypothetical protein
MIDRDQGTRRGDFGLAAFEDLQHPQENRLGRIRDRTIMRISGVMSCLAWVYNGRMPR